MTRDMNFLSHAVEDNEFTLWLSLQLAREGYGVWCDLTKLLGGENWPKEINSALQTRTQKFLFVLSKNSAQKIDPQSELTTAFNIMKREDFKDFIIPIKIDDIKHDVLDYRLQNIQFIDFYNDWALGLAKLLKLFEEKSVLKNPAFNPASVNKWWKTYIGAKNTITNKCEILTSNIFPIISYPKIIYVHDVEGYYFDEKNIKFTAVPFKNKLLCFEDANGTCAALQHLRINNSIAIKINDLINGTSNLTTSEDGKRLVVRLFNQAFWKTLVSKGLQSYKLSNKKYCYYFDDRLLSEGRISFTGNNELNPKIKLWGKSLGETWHLSIIGFFAIEPIWHYKIIIHWLVRDLTKLVYSAPKRVYKNWNNHTIGERLKAAMYHLAGKNDQIVISLGDDSEIRVDKDSQKFKSPISFVDPNVEDFVKDEND